MAHSRNDRINRDYESQNKHATAKPYKRSKQTTFDDYDVPDKYFQNYIRW